MLFTAVDECEQNSPCNGHTCVNLPGSYRCECQDGYSGSDCSVPPDFCADNKCEHGTCETGQNTYTCSCNHGYTGHFCDTVMGRYLNNNIYLSILYFIPYGSTFIIVMLLICDKIYVFKCTYSECVCLCLLVCVYVCMYIVQK